LFSFKKHIFKVHFFKLDTVSEVSVFIPTLFYSSRRCSTKWS